MNAKNQNANYFNFTCDAVAYINEVKIVDVNGYETVAIKGCIIEGKDGKSKSPIDMLVRGKQAAEVIESLGEWWPQGYNSNTPKWFAGIRIGSLKAKPYVSKDGEAKATLSGRLLAIKWLKINGEDVEVPEWNPQQGDENPEQPAEEESQATPQRKPMQQGSAKAPSKPTAKPQQGKVKAQPQGRKPLPKKVA